MTLPLHITAETEMYFRSASIFSQYFPDWAMKIYL